MISDFKINMSSYRVILFVVWIILIILIPVSADDCTKCTISGDNFIVTESMDLMCIIVKDRKKHEIKYLARKEEQCEFIRSILSLHFGKPSHILVKNYIKR